MRRDIVMEQAGCGRKAARMDWVVERLDAMDPAGFAVSDITAFAYQKKAARTINRDLDILECLMEGAMGLAGEAGEVVDVIKKVLFQGHDIEAEEDRIVEELGDVLWYVCEIATVLGMPLGEIMERSDEKLKARYPDGFDAKRSMGRTGSG
jgi:NTP pyrophosphatase (non-canonical NTP hydrolase)